MLWSVRCPATMAELWDAHDNRVMRIQANVVDDHRGPARASSSCRRLRWERAANGVSSGDIGSHGSPEFLADRSGERHFDRVPLCGR